VLIVWFWSPLWPGARVHGISILLKHNSKANFDGFTSPLFSGFPQSQPKDLEFQAMTTFSIFQSPMLIAAFGPS
jgi:hypothetical protein